MFTNKNYSGATLAIAILTSMFLFVANTANAGHGRSNTQGNYLFQIESDGQRLPTYHHKGHTYVAGKKGQRYDLRVFNRSGHRIEAVVTVDGRDVITGKKGNYKKNRGYVIAPYSSVLIEGFRKSWNDVAKFHFTGVSNSYSSRMGTPENVGVIGVAIFKEKVRPKPIPRPIAPIARTNRDKLGTSYGTGAAESSKSSGLSSSHRSNGSDSKSRAKRRNAPSTAESSAGADYDNSYDESYESEQEEKLGTGYGSSTYSPASKTVFKRRSNRPNTRLVTYYDSKKRLMDRGIIPKPQPIVQPVPDPFPENHDPQFAPPPPACNHR